MSTTTATRVSTKQKVAIGVVTLALGSGLAFAGLTLRTQKTYQQVRFSCHDRTSVVTSVNDCRTPSAWQAYAKDYCRGRRNTATGKTGLNSISMGRQCASVSGPAVSGVVSSFPKKR